MFVLILPQLIMIEQQVGIDMDQEESLDLPRHIGRRLLRRTRFIYMGILTGNTACSHRLCFALTCWTASDYLHSYDCIHLLQLFRTYCRLCLVRL